MRERRRARQMTRETAEEIAARALLFLAEDSTRLGRFLAETGLDPRDLPGRLREPAALAAVMGYLRSDESALLAFAANAGLDAEDVERAEVALGGGSPWEST